MQRLYLEYIIRKDRPGLLGDIASILGLLKINILKISSIDNEKRGFLLALPSGLTLEYLFSFLEKIEDLQINYLKKPSLLDYLALKHGERIEGEEGDPPLYNFRREQLNILIDFIGGLLQKEENIVIGFRGLPRIGKTEAAIASCVHANRRWVLISSTLLHKTTRTSLPGDDHDLKKVFIFDALTTMDRSSTEHKKFALSLLKGDGQKIIEHPDIFIHEGIMQEKEFHLFIEIYSISQERRSRRPSGFSSFDIS